MSKDLIPSFEISNQYSIYCQSINFFQNLKIGLKYLIVVKKDQDLLLTSSDGRTWRLSSTSLAVIGVQWIGW